MNVDKGSIIKGIIFVTIALIIGFFGLFVLPDVMRPKTDLRLGSGIFSARIAYDEDSREKGLSGEVLINDSQALLMAFPEDGKHGIWMKGMKFAIDVVWLDRNKKVVYIVKNISPENSTNKTYMPKTVASYVLEFNAGIVERESIKIGDTAVFNISSGDVK